MNTVNEPLDHDFAAAFALMRKCQARAGSRVSPLPLRLEVGQASANLYRLALMLGLDAQADTFLRESYRAGWQWAQRHVEVPAGHQEGQT